MDWNRQKKALEIESTQSLRISRHIKAEKAIKAAKDAVTAARNAAIGWIRKHKLKQISEQNQKHTTLASKEYFQVYVEGDRSYLFTTNDLDKAEKRASKNPEDVIAINFVEPEQPEPVVEVVEKVIEVPAKGVIAKIFSGLFG